MGLAMACAAETQSLSPAQRLAKWKPVEMPFAA